MYKVNIVYISALRIHVSDSTAEGLKKLNRFRLVLRGEIQVKVTYVTSLDADLIMKLYL